VAFARAAAVGSLAGALAEAAFCLAYGRLAARGPWPLALGSSCLAFAEPSQLGSGFIRQLRGARERALRSLARPHLPHDGVHRLGAQPAAVGKHPVEAL